MLTQALPTEPEFVDKLVGPPYWSELAKTRMAEKMQVKAADMKIDDVIAARQVEVQGEEEEGLGRGRYKSVMCCVLAVC